MAPRHFAWQACHLVTSTVVSRGRHGTYGTLAHATPAHTIFVTQLCHAPSVTHTHIFVTHHLSHTSLSHTIFHTPSLSHTIFHIRTSLSHTIFPTHLCHTPSFTPLCHAPFFPLALGDIHLHFAWQAWHLVTSTFVLHCKCGACGTLAHATLAHTIFHTQFCHTPSVTHTHTPSVTFTHHLSNTSLSHTFFVTHHLCHTPSFTHIFVTHHLSHLFVTHHLSHIFVTHQLSHPPSFTHNFVTRNFVAHTNLHIQVFK